ncbi:aspartyl/glutamyl-tRNA amidotransferase subunit C [bacterium]|nr:aspartyl/glutamyl-tRNA amidotransferase subunit C [bacterium]
MQIHVTDQDTKKIAELIRIHIEDDKIGDYTSQLNTALDATEVLKELNTENITETSQTHGLTNILAEDVPQQGLEITEYPNRANLDKSYFVVEKVL